MYRRHYDSALTAFAAGGCLLTVLFIGFVLIGSLIFR